MISKTPVRLRSAIFREVGAMKTNFPLNTDLATQVFRESSFLTLGFLLLILLLA